MKYFREKGDWHKTRKNKFLVDSWRSSQEETAELDNLGLDTRLDQKIVELLSRSHQKLQAMQTKTCQPRVNYGQPSQITIIY